MRYRPFRRFATALLLSAGGAVIVAHPAGEQASSSPALTAGQVALLGNKLDAAAGQALANAMSASDPLVRTVAARVAGVTAHAPFADPIAAAFEREQDGTAAAEQARALLLIRGAASTEIIEARIASLSPSAVGVYAIWVANNQPGRLADLLPKLAGRASEDRGELAASVPIALRKFDGRQEDSGRLVRAWLSVSTPESWSAMLDRLSSEAGGAWRDAVLIEALGSKDSGISDATAWGLVEWVAQNRPVSSRVIDAAVSGIAPEAASSPTWSALGREMLARHSGRKMPDRAALLTAEAARHRSDARNMATLPQLTTNDEKQALRSLLGKSYPSPGPSLASQPQPVSTGSMMRTMPALWPGFLKSLFEATGCKPERTPAFGVATVAYRPDGRIAKLGVDGSQLKQECVAAMTALARMTLEHSLRKAATGGSEVLVFPLGTEYLECVERDPADESESAVAKRVGGEIDPPRKTRDVKPVYPPLLLQQGVAGAVALEAVISKSGCVSGLAVLRGVAPAMDLSALRAVTGWQFTPTVLNGNAVPIVMTMTVTFSIG